MDRSTRIDISQASAPGLLRRLAALVYDSLLICALLIFAHTLVVVGVMSLTGFNPAALAESSPYIVFWCCIPLGFFLWFWTHGGQTLGMRVWRIRVVTDQGLPLTFTAAALRLCAALLSWAALGLGFAWVLIDRQRLAWHDRLSATRLVTMQKKSAR